MKLKTVVEKGLGLRCQRVCLDRLVKEQVLMIYTTDKVGEYSYLRNDRDHLAWDNTPGRSPVALLKEIECHFDEKSKTVTSKSSQYLFEMSTLLKHRTFLKASSADRDVKICIALTPDCLFKYIEHAQNDTNASDTCFMQTEHLVIPGQGAGTTLYEKGLTLACSESQRSTLAYVACSRTIIHHETKTRLVVVDNGVVVYDNDDDTWLISYGDSMSHHADFVAEFVRSGRWQGTVDAETTSPVMVAGDTATIVSDSATLAPQRRTELSNMPDCGVYAMPRLVALPSAIFKHAHSVHMQCMSLDASKLQVWYSVSNPMRSSRFQDHEAVTSIVQWTLDS